MYVNCEDEKQIIHVLLNVYENMYVNCEDGKQIIYVFLNFYETILLT